MIKKNFLYYLMPSITIGVLSIFVMVLITTYYLNPKDFEILQLLTLLPCLAGRLLQQGIVGPCCKLLQNR